MSIKSTLENPFILYFSLQLIRFYFFVCVFCYLFVLRKKSFKTSNKLLLLFTGTNIVDNLYIYFLSWMLYVRMYKIDRKKSIERLANFVINGEGSKGDRGRKEIEHRTWACINRAYIFTSQCLISWWWINLFFFCFFFLSFCVSSSTVYVYLPSLSHITRIDFFSSWLSVKQK